MEQRYMFEEVERLMDRDPRHVKGARCRTRAASTVYEFNINNNN